MKLKFSNFKTMVWKNMRPTFLPIAGGVHYPIFKLTWLRTQRKITGASM